MLQAIQFLPCVYHGVMPKSGNVYQKKHKDLANNARFHIVAAYFLQVVKKSNIKDDITGTKFTLIRKVQFPKRCQKRRIFTLLTIYSCSKT